MLAWIREKFGKEVIGGIISFIAFVFIFYGVFSPKSTRGLHEGAVAGVVNGESISISEFNRELNRRIEFFKSMSGGKITDEQIKQFQVREAVFQELVNRKLLIQEADRQGLQASDEEVKSKIQEIPQFSKDGHFDVKLYRDILAANQYSAGSFEKSVREDLSLGRWENYFKDHIRVSEGEVEREFKLKNNLRNIKYVLFTSESAKAQVNVEPAEIQKFLADSSKASLIAIKYERLKGSTFQGKTLDQSKEAIARDILASDRLDAIQKINDQQAAQAVSLLGLTPASDRKLNESFSGTGVEVKTTGEIGLKRGFIPGIGDVPDLVKDAFSMNSPIDLTAGGKPKKYTLAGRVVVAAVVGSKSPDLSQFGAQREVLFQELTAKKVKLVFDSWMKTLVAQGQVESNAAVVSPD
ncbi:MAG: SurA N-terminal domain-containing protein [Bdellovibrionia bacterium]